MKGKEVVNSAFLCICTVWCGTSEEGEKDSRLCARYSNHVVHWVVQKCKELCFPPVVIWWIRCLQIYVGETVREVTVRKLLEEALWVHARSRCCSGASRSVSGHMFVWFCSVCRSLTTAAVYALPRTLSPGLNGSCYASIRGDGFSFGHLSGNIVHPPLSEVSPSIYSEFFQRFPFCFLY